ncbi:MAG TPA: hypothetical protein PL010_14175 [Flavobacteriales bacterium]|nr:hypothetical protein [Flavobacteriales bacterium]
MQNMTPRCAPDERLELVDPADPALAGTSRSRILRNCLTTLVCISFLLRTGTVNAQFSIAATGTTYTQDFNSLTNGAWADGSTLNGWYARTDATPTISSYGANTGSTTTAGLYAFGVAGVGPLTDRALGYAPSNAFTGSAGTGKGYVGWRLKNNTGVTVAGVTVTWTGEQWRDNNNSAAHSLELSWQTGAVVSDPVGGPWTPAAPSFTSPQHSGGTAVLDGNSATNRTVGISVTFSVTIPAGEEIMLRWEDLNNSGNDHFLTIDDVSVSVSCIDSDGDSVCDELDGCPSDPLKTAAGICGCGVADTDSDSDGTADCNDGCPNDPLKTAAGICGCGVADTDSDGDGTADCNDGCPNDPLKTAAGICGCGVADTDSDSDGTADCNDLCPADPLKIAPGLCGCGIPEGSCNDCLGVPAGPDQPGTPCNDGDACTVNDTWSLGCICSGTYEDLDNDGICDANEDEPNMRLGVVEAPGNMLELRLLPDHFFNDLVSATVITVRWLTTPGVSITGASAAYVDPAYTPAVGALQYGGTTTDGPYSYATFFTFGNGSLFDEGISWTANTEVPFFRVPYVNTGNACVTFEVMDDTYQIDNNLQWFISLNALDKTNGYISGKTNVVVYPAVQCQNVTATLDITGNTDVTPAQVSTSFVGCPPVSLSLDQSHFTCADLGTNTVTLTAVANSVTTTCNATVTVVSADADGDLTLDCFDGCPLDPAKIAPGICGCGNVDTDLDNDLVCDADEDEPNMQLGVVLAPGSQLELRLLPDHFFNDLVSATVITVRWLTTPGVSITGASAAYVDPAYTPAVGALQYGGTTTDGPYSYATFFTFGNGSLFDEGISWTANTEVPFFRVPYVNTGNACVTFEVMDDTYQIDNNLQWFISLNALDKTDGYIPGKTSVCADPSSVMITSKVILEGGWQSGPSLMRDDLRVLANFPLAHPYGSAPFNHSGTETTTPSVLAAAGSNAIVDWVLLELRDPLTPALVLASRAALLQRDGDIVDVNGIDPVTFNGTTPGNYYLAVRHRNHLGIMTTSALAMSPMTPMIDFTLGSTPTYGTDARTTLGPVSAMWCGNVEPDDQLKYTGSTNDRDPILVAIGAIPTATVTDYLPTDVTLDGVVKYTGAGNDRDPILVNIGGSVPTAIRPEQLP